MVALKTSENKHRSKDNSLSSKTLKNTFSGGWTSWAGGWSSGAGGWFSGTVG